MSESTLHIPAGDSSVSDTLREFSLYSILAYGLFLASNMIPASKDDFGY